MLLGRAVPGLALSRRHREKEGRAFVFFGFDPNVTAIPFDDFLTDRQADSCAGILIGIMEALKNAEYLVCVGRCDPDSIVLNADLPEPTLPPASDLDFNGGFASIFNRVPD
jgi:hypothetical protein